MPTTNKTRSTTSGSARQDGSGRAGSDNGGTLAQPLVRQRRAEIQPYGTIAPLPNTLDPKASRQVVAQLNQILADTMTLRDLYKKHHWQVAGPTFYQLHLLFDKHFAEQVELVDVLAERIQLLGGLSIAMAQDVAETTRIERPPRGREEVPVQISRLLEAHELILGEAHEAAKHARRGRRRRNERPAGERRGANQRAAGLVPGRAPGGRAHGSSRVASEPAQEKVERAQRPTEAGCARQGGRPTPPIDERRGRPTRSSRTPGLNPHGRQP